MTDNDIIKALEFCSNCVCDNEKTETECPLINMPFCKNYLRKQSIDLINRQKAEIEMLTSGKCIYLSDDETTEYCVEGPCKAYETKAMIRAKAVKEFWNQRPPHLNPDFKGKEQYNKGWNDCLALFTEEYEIFLGVKNRKEYGRDNDPAKEMVGDPK